MLADAAPPELLLGDDDLKQLEIFCRDNIAATARGATPNYYLAGVADGSVLGISLRIHVEGRTEPLPFDRLLLRNPFPLQSTLYQMSETAGLRLKAEGWTRIQPSQLEVKLAVLYQPALQGTVAEPDLGGVDPRHRALLVSQHPKSAWRYDPAATAEQLLDEVTRQAQITVPEHAVLYSFITQAREVPWQTVHVPRALAGGEARPPAVAGTFYPAEPARLNDLLDDLTPDEPVEPARWQAALVPHAGLIYSGRIAADVLRRIEIPDTVIVLGPKHTGLGVDWAVAPHKAWMLPGALVDSDPELAELLAAGIDGLELDAAAHQREHAIEVELPWLSRYAPSARVVGIAIGQANLALCRQFGAQLADVLKDRIDRTLLVISSDMNHFANDQETRRVDVLALEAIASLDPDRLYHTVRDHHISMCGMLPACIVLDCLGRLDRLSECQTGRLRYKRRCFGRHVASRRVRRIVVPLGAVGVAT